MSIISAGTSTGNALVTTGDTNGNLVFKTNNGTTALTLGTDQSATFAGAVSATGGFTGVIAPTTNGTSGQVLTSNGTSTPGWSTPATGAMTLISTQNLSGNSQVTWTGLSGYGTYMIVWNNMQSTNVSDSAYIYPGYGATPTYLTSSEYYAARASGSGTCYAYSRTDGIYIGDTLNTGKLSGFCIVSGGTVGTNMGFSGSLTSPSIPGGPGAGMMAFSGNVVTTSHPITAFKVILTNGSYSFTAGQVSLYGITS